jgi:hypothetical protein
VREVTGADYRDALTPGPPREVLQIAVPAAGSGVPGMNMQIGVEDIRAHYS